QCNNAYSFPGIGLGIISSGALRVTDEMMMAASEALASHSPLVNTGSGLVLPPLTDIQQVSKDIAFAVGKMAQQQGGAAENAAHAGVQGVGGGTDPFHTPPPRPGEERLASGRPTRPRTP
ncbi:malic enzyme-like NAD(P)-binding protein, partial [Salmonella enterica]|uniref:malic enzyme-like NAD(P)-binding protein n=1 Tax=Salmonella enterica TaxID=28901 RepID=UPI000A66FC9B